VGIISRWQNKAGGRGGGEREEKLPCGYGKRARAITTQVRTAIVTLTTG